MGAYFRCEMNKESFCSVSKANLASPQSSVIIKDCSRISCIESSRKILSHWILNSKLLTGRNCSIFFHPNPTTCQDCKICTFSSFIRFSKKMNFVNYMGNRIQIIQTFLAIFQRIMKLKTRNFSCSWILTDAGDKVDRKWKIAKRRGEFEPFPQVGVIFMHFRCLAAFERAKCRNVGRVVFRSSRFSDPVNFTIRREIISC